MITTQIKALRAKTEGAPATLRTVGEARIKGLEMLLEQLMEKQRTLQNKATLQQ
jgi:hypothetical protein